MPPPLASNPHRVHEDRSEIAQDLVELARRPLRPALPTEWVGTPDLGEDDFDDVGAEPRCSLARPGDASAAGGRPAGKCAGLRQTLAMADKLTVTVKRIDGGKLRCTGATWSDAVVIHSWEALALVNIERQVLPSAPRLPRYRTAGAGPGPLGVPAWHDPAVVVPAVPVARAGSDAEHSPEANRHRLYVLQPGFETLGWAYSGGQL
jgi:hypothetical protein